MRRTLQGSLQDNHTSWISTCPVRKQQRLRITFTCSGAKRTDDRWKREAILETSPRLGPVLLMVGPFCPVFANSFRPVAVARPSTCSPKEGGAVVAHTSLSDSPARSPISTPCSEIHATIPEVSVGQSVCTFGCSRLEPTLILMLHFHRTTAQCHK